tara:strand:+ start:373 stop:735 length:363 start_codon:yes stop_codon:yes gene_type:complete
MISKFFSKLKSILFKSAVSSESSLKKEKKPTKSAKPLKTKTKTKSKSKSKPKTKTKTKTSSSTKNFETLTTLPGVGAKSAKALYEAGFKTTKSVIAADEKDLLAVSGVGINLVKKLKTLK